MVGLYFYLLLIKMITLGKNRTEGSKKEANRWMRVSYIE